MQAVTFDSWGTPFSRDYSRAVHAMRAARRAEAARAWRPAALRWRVAASCWRSLWLREPADVCERRAERDGRMARLMMGRRTG